MDPLDMDKAHDLILLCLQEIPCRELVHPHNWSGLGPYIRCQSKKIWQEKLCFGILFSIHLGTWKISIEKSN